MRDYQRPFNILKTYQAVEPISGKAAGEAILRDFPEKQSVDVIFTVNDGGGLNVVKVMADAGRSEIVVATIDGDPDSIRNIQQQKLTHIDSAQFCGPMGSQAMMVAADHLNGNAVAHHLLLPVYPITRGTLGGYPGWEGPIPDNFIKPWHSKEPTWGNLIKEFE